MKLKRLAPLLAALALAACQTPEVSPTIVQLPSQGYARGIDMATDSSDVASELQGRPWLNFVARYYRDPASRWPALSPSEAQRLSALGVKIVTVWEWHSSSPAYFNYATGYNDALSAVRQAQAVGQPPGTAIYFAVDFNARGSAMLAVDQYFRGVNAGLAAAGRGRPEYRAGVYGSGAVCASIRGAGLAQYAWLSGSTAWDGSAGYNDWNIRQGAQGARFANLSFDHDANEARSDYGGFQLGNYAKAAPPPAEPVMAVATAAPAAAATLLSGAATAIAPQPTAAPPPPPIPAATAVAVAPTSPAAAEARAPAPPAPTPPPAATVALAQAPPPAPVAQTPPPAPTPLAVTPVAFAQSAPPPTALVSARSASGSAAEVAALVAAEPRVPLAAAAPRPAAEPEPPSSGRHASERDASEAPTHERRSAHGIKSPPAKGKVHTVAATTRVVAAPRHAAAESREAPHKTAAPRRAEERSAHPQAAKASVTHEKPAKHHSEQRRQ